jgi:hypothetical protein
MIMPDQAARQVGLARYCRVADVDLAYLSMAL